MGAASALVAALKRTPPGRAAGRALWRARLRAQRRRGTGGILMYHRVARETSDAWGLCVAPESFDQHMAVLARHRAGIDLGEFGASGGGYSMGGRHLAVTFDDGYADNVSAALPILERHDIPATIFVASAALSRRREFWWDALERAMLHGPALPAELHIRLGADTHHFTLNDSAADAEAGRTWSAEESAPRTDRERIYTALWELLTALPPAEQDEKVDEILSWAGMAVAPPPGRMPATPDEFARLAAHPLITLGSHTRHHRMLPAFDAATQANEIQRGHREIEALAGKRVDRFSYPFGRYDDVARAQVRALGVDVACTSECRPAARGDDVLELPRLTVYDQDGDRFERWLRDDFGLLDG